MYIIIFWLYIFSCIIFNILLHMPIHVYVYTHTHTYIHTYAHTRSHTQSHTCTHARMHERARTHTSATIPLRHWYKLATHVQIHRRRVQTFQSTRPTFPPTRPKLFADTSKLPTDASKVSHRRDYLLLDASASRVGYAADATRNQWINRKPVKLMYPQGMCFKKILLCKHSGKGTMKPRFPPMQGEELPTSWYR